MEEMRLPAGVIGPFDLAPLMRACSDLESLLMEVSLRRQLWNGRKGERGVAEAGGGVRLVESADRDGKNILEARDWVKCLG